MQLEITFFSFIELLTFSVAFMLGIIFFTIPSANRKGNIFLGLLLLVISFEISNSVFKITEINNLWQAIFEVFVVFSFTPLLYLYTFQTTNKSFKKILWILVLPAFLVNIFIYFSPFPTVVLPFFKILLYLFEITLLVFTLQEIHFTKLKLKNLYSQLENKKINWIKALVYFSVIYLIVDFMQDFLSFKNESNYLLFDKITTIFDFTLVYWVAYHGFTQSEIFKNQLFQDVSIQENENSNFIENQNKFKQLKTQIVAEKIYLDAELSLRSLSNHLNINEKELSMLINKYSKTNFYQFINAFRVEEFIILSKTEKAQQFSIIGLAQEAGFTSKSTFYNAFKSVKNKTPKQYLLSVK